MGALTMEEIAELLVLPEDLQVQAVRSSLVCLTIRLTSASAFACCPYCQTVSHRIHGHYGRTLADLPCVGRRVVLALTVHKFKSFAKQAGSRHVRKNRKPTHGAMER